MKPPQPPEVMLRALIVEDEEAARERLRTLCERAGGVEVVGVAESAREAIQCVARCRPNLVFLDVQLRGSSAFELLQALPESDSPLVVFTTAHAEHAVAAFERAAVDYLLKPFSDERFRIAVGRVRERVATQESAGHAASRAQWLELLSHLDGLREDRAGARVLGEKQQRLFLLHPRDIESAAAGHNYVTLMARGETYLARISMRQLEARLEGTAFVRIHKSLMINLDHVRHLERAPRGSFLITLRSGAQCRSSPIYRGRILSRTSDAQ